MRPTRRNNRPAYAIGVLCSLVSHLLLAVVVILVLESRAAEAVRAPEVFTVTLEGGEKLGGVTQIPDKMPDKQQKAPTAVHSEEEQLEETKAPETEVAEPEAAEPEAAEAPAAEEEAAPEPEVVEKPIESPSAVAERAEKEAAQKAAEAKRIAENKKKEEEKAKEEKAKAEAAKKKAAEAKKKADEAKKKADEAKRKADEEKKKIEEAKKRELEKKVQEAKARADRKKAFEQRLSQVRKGLSEKKYEGESYDAGGEGFGAARLGGQGMGGGTLASIEKVAYMNALEEHIKRGWRWIMGNQKLTAIVRFRILEDGTLQNVSLAQSSGNGNFDDSVMRAVQKASPVPPPPAKFYRDFSDVRLIFDSKE